MQLVDAFVRNPVKIAVGTLLVALFGFVALTRMPMQLTPEVQTPTITIETRWPGASPQEIEREIIIEQEEQLKGVEGATKLSSESSDSMGKIIIEFAVGTDMGEALLKVNSRLQQVREYPIDADQPVITTANSSDQPIAWFMLTAKRPSAEELNDLAAEHPDLAGPLARIRDTHNVGLAMLRLRELAADHPEVNALLPPPDLDVTKLRRFAEDEIEARFERVEGVSQSNVIGGLEDELQVVVDPEKLAARQLTYSDVRDVLVGQNRDVAAGDFWEGKRRYVVRVPGQFRSPDQVSEQLLAVRDGAPVYVRDVAEVRMGFKKPDSLVRRFGESSIAVNCIRATNANVLDVMGGLKRMEKEVNEQVLFPKGLQITQVYDETEYIYSAVDLVTQNIFIGGALTMIVLMMFLHLGVRTLLAIPFIAITAIAAAYLSPWYFAVCLAILLGVGFWFARGALVVALAIPTSIIGTFLVLGMLGRSLNVISLAGLAFAVGMLVDNAVVVLENIYSHYARGDKPFTAAVKGAQEVWGAVTASTLTTVAVFIPVIFVQEQAGQLFRDIALAISAAVGLSLIVSVTLIPTAAARLLRKPKGEGLLKSVESNNGSPLGNGRVQSHSKEQTHAPKPIGISEKLSRAIVAPITIFSGAFVAAIAGSNRWIQRGTMRRLAVVTWLVAASVGISWLLWPKVEYLPTGNRNLVIGFIIPSPGYNIDKLTDLGQKVETALRPYWDIDVDDPKLKELPFPAIGDFFFVVRGRMVFMGLRSLDPLRAGELVKLINELRLGKMGEFKIGEGFPGAIITANQSSIFEQGLAAGRTIDIEITGPNIEKLVAIGGQVMGAAGQQFPDAQIRPDPSLDLSSPEMHVQPKLLQSAEMGMSTSDIGFAVNALVDGAYAGDYYVGGKKIDLTVMGKADFANATQKIAALPIATPIGQLVPLEAVATPRLDSGPEQLNHRERERAITIKVSPPATIALESAMDTIQTEIVAGIQESGQLDGGYRIALAGTADKLRETWNALRFNIILALLITYLLMAALFESWLYPLVIIFSVPLGAVGGIIGLKLLNQFTLQPLDVLTMLGFVILIGTVVNNPILIVHQALNLMREEGMDQREAIVESTRTRVRPIFMTTITTVLGLLPLVLFPGAGSELYRGLGSVVLGGLIISTVFTLVLVPTLFSLTMDARRWFVNLLPGEPEPAKAEVPAPHVPAASPARRPVSTH